MKKIFYGAFCLLVFAFFSCSARINGSVSQGGAAELQLKTVLEPRTSAIIRSIQSFLGGPAGDKPVLDGAAMSRSMAAAPGIRTVSLINTGPSALEGTINVTNIGDFLHLKGEENRFISFTEDSAPGSSSIVLTLNRETAPFIISRISPEAEEYLSALMAPVVLGEDCTRKEYLDLLSMVYGQAMADEVAAARIHASIEFPRPVTAVRGGTASGKLAEFEVPLLDVLVLENPLNYEIRW